MTDGRVSVVRYLLRRDLLLLTVFSACVGEPLDLGHNTASLTTQSSIVVDQDGTPVTFKVHANLSGSETLQSLAVAVNGDPLPGGGFGAPVYDVSGQDAWITLSANMGSPPAAYGADGADAGSAGSDGGPVYTLTVTANSGLRALASDPINVDVAVVASVAPQPTDALHGHLQEFIGTGFQPADWQNQFFPPEAPDDGGSDAGDDGSAEGDAALDATAAALGSGDGGAGFGDAGALALLDRLAPNHIVIQLMNGGAIPLHSWSDPPLGTDWNFDELNAIVQPVLRYAQVSGAQVELQVKDFPNAIAPTDTASFATYCADLVHYYNDPNGFIWGDTTFRSPRPIPIPWWGILSDWNVTMSAGEYAEIYNAVVPAMLEVDPTIQFSAFEFAVFSSLRGDAHYFLPPFLQQVLPTAPINAVSLHLYASSLPPDEATPPTDASLFAAVPNSFVSQLNYVVPTVQAAMGSATQVWVTQNNVNSDSPTPQGYSQTDLTELFIDDPRGTSAFFAAWRPYVFAELGKVGNQGLAHWEFTSGHCPPTATQYCATFAPDSGIDAAALDTDIQNAEVNYTTLQPYLSYWVDQSLGRMFPSAPPGPTLLQVKTTESNVANYTASGPSIDVLATQNLDNSVVVMVVDIAPERPDTVNGSGQPRTVIVDLSALLTSLDASAPPTFSTASTLTIDKTTVQEPSLVNLPTVPDTSNPRVTLTFPNGYGVIFLKLNP